MALTRPAFITFFPQIVHDGADHNIQISGQGFLVNGCTFAIADNLGGTITTSNFSCTSSNVVTGTYRTTSPGSQVQVTVTNTSNGSSAANLSPWVDVVSSEHGMRTRQPAKE